MRIRVKITGRQYHMSKAFPDVLNLSDGATIDSALEAIGSSHGPLPPGALIAVSGEHLGTVADHRPTALIEDDEVLIFSPVAGG